MTIDLLLLALVDAMLEEASRQGGTSNIDDRRRREARRRLGQWRALWWG